MTAQKVLNQWLCKYQNVIYFLYELEVSEGVSTFYKKFSTYTNNGYKELSLEITSEEADVIKAGDIETPPDESLT